MLENTENHGLHKHAKGWKIAELLKILIPDRLVFINTPLKAQYLNQSFISCILPSVSDSD